jgi:transcription termination/antitermination protein NusG
MTEEKVINTEENTEENTEAKVEETSEVKSEEIQDDPNSNFRWYAVRIISGHEKKVKAHLDAEIKFENMSDKIRNVLIPEEKVFEVKGGKKKVKLKNFLPGYILIEADLDEKVRKFIANTPSIINVVGTKSIKGQKLEAVPLRTAEVSRIKAILDSETKTEKIDIQLKVGDPVKVTSGPFNNFSGNVLEVNIEKMKLKVMVSIFGRKTPIELDFTEVEKEK